MLRSFRRGIVEVFRLGFAALFFLLLFGRPHEEFSALDGNHVKRDAGSGNRFGIGFHVGFRRSGGVGNVNLGQIPFRAKLSILLRHRDRADCNCNDFQQEGIK